MAKYVLRYCFELGGTCLWSVNDNAKNKFDYPIDNDELPVSKNIVDELYALEEEYHGYIDWNYPPNPSPWTTKQKLDLKKRANMVYLKLL
ncbi:hypothetical protein [Clostridium uliginosum]|uniref:Uncharacterized protein n=1 Tax=Clostridium uliginosum TaxID=119641 RepID=A0A1I1NI16_9CLOT|nr:hypothetical protein [Clostridium uliginosum]SFC97177.1 hypothetical protein SAMN05421842_11563 [Clostridium uliginosum]